MTGSDHRVLYLDYDGGGTLTRSLHRAAFRAAGFDEIPGNVHYLSSTAPNPRIPYDGPLVLEAMGEAIARHVRAEGIDLVVVDSLGQAMTGDPNTAHDVVQALRGSLNPARAEGAAVLVLDHTSKVSSSPGRAAATPMGSQQKRAWARVSVLLEAVKYGPGYREIRWTVDKTNTSPFAPLLTRHEFEQDENGRLAHLRMSASAAGDKTTSAKRLGGAKTGAREEILNRLARGPVKRGGFKPGGTHDRAFQKLREEKIVTQLEDRSYVLVEISMVCEPSVTPS